MADLFTRREYALLPEGFPAQLIEGNLVRQPSPTYGHARHAFDLAVLLRPLVPPGCVALAPIDVPIDDWNVFQPDVVVLRRAIPDDSPDAGIPLLAIEVLSPSTESRDRRVKCRRMLAAGVVEVWLVDPRSKTVEVHDAGGARSAGGDVALASRAVPGFEVVPAALFAAPA